MPFSVLIKALWYNHKRFSCERFGPWALVSLKKSLFDMSNCQKNFVYPVDALLGYRYLHVVQ